MSQRRRVSRCCMSPTGAATCGPDLHLAATGPSCVFHTGATARVAAALARRQSGGPTAAACIRPAGCGSRGRGSPSAALCTMGAWATMTRVKRGGRGGGGGGGGGPCVTHGTSNYPKVAPAPKTRSRRVFGMADTVSPAGGGETAGDGDVALPVAPGDVKAEIADTAAPAAAPSPPIAPSSTAAPDAAPAAVPAAPVRCVVQRARARESRAIPHPSTLAQLSRPGARPRVVFGARPGVRRSERGRPHRRHGMVVLPPRTTGRRQQARQGERSGMQAIAPHMLLEPTTVPADDTRPSPPPPPPPAPPSPGD
jgi:hypothetical protein